MTVMLRIYRWRSIGKMNETALMTDQRAAVSLISHVFNVSLSLVNEGQERPCLVETSQYIGEFDGKATLDFENVVSLLCTEVVAIHVSGTYKSVKPSPSKQKGNGEKIPSLDPLSGSTKDETEMDDVASVLTRWFLESIERSYEYERQNPKVKLEKKFMIKDMLNLFRLTSKAIQILIRTSYI